MGQSRWMDDDRIRRKRGHPVFRATNPLSRGTLKSKGGGKLSKHFSADGDTIETVSRTIISVNQLSIYGAVSDLCEEYSTRQTSTGTRIGRTIWPIVRASKLRDNDTKTFDWVSCTRKFIAEVQGTSGKASTTKSCDSHLYWCRILAKKLEVGQYFMTKHTDEILQFAEPVTCREYTLPRDEKSTDPKGWIRWNTKIGPVLEVTTSYLRGKYGVEIRSGPVTKDNSAWTEQVGHRLDRRRIRRQRAGNLWNEDGSICVCKPIKG